MKIQAVTNAMHIEADKFATYADEILTSQQGISKLIGNMGHDFNGKLPTLMTQNILSMDKKYQSMNETLKEYSGFIHHAAEIYDANDAQLAAMAAALGVNPKRPVRPVQGGIFTNTHGEGHNGIDLALPAGSPIVAAVGGTVITDSNDGSQNDGYGNFVKILGDDGNTYYYAHMSNTADRADGSRVEPGEVIGYVGSTGNSTGNHLHFEIRDPDGRQLNPEEVHPDIW